MKMVFDGLSSTRTHKYDSNLHTSFQHKCAADVLSRVHSIASVILNMTVHSYSHISKNELFFYHGRYDGFMIRRGDIDVQIAGGSY